MPTLRQMLIDRFWRNVEKTDGCWKWKAATSQGYGVLGYGHSKMYRAHRLSYEIHKGIIPKGLYVCHKCDNRFCTNPNHLFLGTPMDNVTDNLIKDRKHGHAVLRQNDVRRIYDLRSKGYTQRSIAKMFGVCQSTIGHICTGRNWPHVFHLTDYSIQHQ